MFFPELDNEVSALDALTDLNILDTPAERVFDDLIRLAAMPCKTPIALISPIDEDRQWFKSRVGLNMCEAARDMSFCTHLIFQKDLFIVPDALKDERFAENPLATGSPFIRFYAGVPLISQDGYAYGTLCVIDRKPSRLNSGQKETLISLARQTFAQLNRRRQAAELIELNKKLGRSSENLRFLTEAVPHQIWTAFSAGEVFYCNNRATQYIGRKAKKEPLGANWLKFAHLENVKRAVERWTRSMQTGEVYETELRLQRADGEYRRHLVQAVPMRDARGETVQWLGINTNVHERRLADETLRKSEEYRNFFRHANDAILIFEPKDEIVLDVSDKACEIYRRRREDFIRRSMKDMTLNASRGADELEKLLRDGVYDEFESIHLRGDDTPIHVLTNTSVIEYDSQPAVITINRDTTNRRQMAEDLREREQHLLSVTNSAQDAIVSADNRGNIIFWNEGARKIFGYEEDEVVGKSLSILMPEKYRRAHAEGMRRYAETGEPRVIGKVVELEGLRKDGGTFPLELSLGVWKAAKGLYFTGVMRDVTERQRAGEELKKSVSLLTSTFEATADGILVVSTENEIVAFNEKFAQLWGMSGEEPGSLETADVLARIINQIKDIPGYSENTDFIDFQLEKSTFDVLELKDGRVFERYSQSQKLGDKVIGRVFSFRDITSRRQAESETSKLAAIVESSSDAIISKSLAGIIQSWNAGAEKLFGYSAEEAVGRHISFLFPPERLSEETKIIKSILAGNPIEQFETVRVRRDKTHVPVSVTISPIKNADGKIVGISKIAHDITERKRAEEQLLYDAFHDGLTGLANRRLFMEHLQTHIERARRSGGEDLYAVLFLDFDGFKVINDSLGHPEGDKLLLQIAHRLESALRPGDVVARLGGDEFTILLSGLDDDDDALRVAERIREILKKPFDLAGREVFISASIGIALGTGNTNQRAEEMLRDADIAMYRAKSKGKAQHQIFDRQMHEQVIKRLRLETEVRQAVEREEFCVFYQPIVDIETSGLIGFESLIRWRHPERGLIPPLEFIPIAEENNLIIPIGKWILHESCRQLRRWQTDFPSAADLTVSVNLSCKEFSQLDLAEQIAETLKKTGLEPRFLKLEITESHVMENSETAVSMMNRLRALGVQLSLDDFGTGYSSLSYLHRLPLNYLKIDRSFVTGMAESRENEAIVHTIIRLAQNLKMNVIAEGIETAAQLKQLKQLECRYGQGYFFSKPLDAKDAGVLIGGARVIPPELSGNNSTVNLSLIG